MSQEFFPKKSEASPNIYAYELHNDTTRQNQLKIGFTNRSAKERIKEQVGATHAEYNILLLVSDMRNDGSSFSDIMQLHYIHKPNSHLVNDL